MSDSGGTGRGVLCLTVGTQARLAVSDSGGIGRDLLCLTVGAQSEVDRCTVCVALASLLIILLYVQYFIRDFVLLV